MKFSTIATALLGANAALAARFTEKRRERNAARLARRQGSPRLPATDSQGLEINAADSANGTLNEEYSSNWAGAVLIGSGYKSVTGTFVVPTPKSAGSSSTEVSLRLLNYVS